MVLAGVASLKEIDEHYDINDLADANLALDLQEEAQEKARRK